MMPFTAVERITAAIRISSMRSFLFMPTSTMAAVNRVSSTPAVTLYRSYPMRTISRRTIRSKKSAAPISTFLRVLSRFMKSSHSNETIAPSRHAMRKTHRLFSLFMTAIT